jgi:hypothetical protein
MRKTMAVTMTVLALLLVPSVLLAGRPIDETRKAAPDGTVDINNLNGSVTVTGWDENRVAVTGSLGDGPDRLEVSGSKSRTVIKVIWPHESHTRSKEPTDLEVKVPHGSQVRVEGVNLTIEVSDVTGVVDLQTVNGRIDVSGEPAEVDAKTVNGTVEVDVDTDRIKAETVNGGVKVSGGRGEVSARSVSGAVEVKGDDFTSAELSTVSGSVRFEGSLKGNGTFDFESHSGDVVLRLPADVDADFDVNTFSGDVVNELGPPARRTSKYAPGKSVEFTTGDGGAQVSVDSFSGTVRLLKK